MNIQAVDLNLFCVFQAIYDLRSVTQAGLRLDMTQSAVSNALRRLRERFDDPLFVRTPEGMVPTPLAQRLIGPVQTALEQLAEALDQSNSFDPATSSRTFRVVVNEIAHVVLMPRLFASLRALAPRVRIQTIDIPPREVRQHMLQGQFDLAVGSWEPMGPTFFQQRLFDERFVALRSTRGDGATVMTAEQYLEANHVVYRPRGTTDAEMQQMLQRTGSLSKRRVLMTLGHAPGLADVVRSSDLLLTTTSRLARAMAAQHADLQVLDLPFAGEPFPIRQQWHERFHRDAGNRWLREQIFGLFHEPSRAAQPGALVRARREPAAA